MTDESNATRRSFLKGSAIMAVPIAVGVPTVALAAANESETRLRRLEDEAAIRALHRDWLARVNGRSATAALFVTGRAAAEAAACLDSAVCAITPDHSADDRIHIAGDGKRASGQYLCLFETEAMLAPDSSLARMALAQGGGRLRLSERQAVRAEYLKAGDQWLIAHIETRLARL